MRTFRRVVGVLLLAAFAISSAGAQVFMVPAAPNRHPAGCHGHALPAPEPAPLSYQCCIAGHNHAVPGSWFAGVTSLPSFGAAGDPVDVLPISRFGHALSVVIPSSLSSPRSICLRI
jgi:hypothetical protein